MKAKKSILILISLILIIVISVFVINKIKISKIQYEITQIDEYKYFLYKQGDNYGVIDKEGNTVIEANYSTIVIPNLQRDVFICYNEEEIKTLNSRNEEIFTQFEEVEAIRLVNSASTLCYEKSVLKYKQDQLYGLIDYEGNIIIENKYNSIENMPSTEGKFIVSKNEKYGVINLKGTEIVKAEYDKIDTDEYYKEETNFIRSGFIVSNKKTDGYKYGYIDYKGDIKLSTKYNSITRITNIDDKNIYLIVQENGKYGLYKNSRQIVKPQYQSISYDENTNNLIVQKNKVYGVIGLDSKIKIDINNTNVESRGEYIYTQTKDKNCVYDENGNQVDINFSRSIYPIENTDYKISTLENNNIIYYGIVNKNNTVLVNEEYRYLENIYGDYFIAKDQGEKLGVINSNGKVLLEFKYDLIQLIKGTNLIQTLISDEQLTEIYDSKLNNIYSKNNVEIINKQKYVKLVSNDGIEYVDEEGNKISENNNIVINTNLRTEPDNIGEYKKEQYTLNDVYYVKK